MALSCPTAARYAFPEPFEDMVFKGVMPSLYPRKPRTSRFAFYQDVQILDSIDDPCSRKIVSYAFDIFEKWLKRRSAYVYSLKTPAKVSNGFYVDDEIYQDTALLLIETMIFASRADAKIDRDERESMLRVYKAVFSHEDARGMVDALLTGPIDLGHLISHVQYREEAIDVYSLSSAILHCGTHFMEEWYLEELSSLLKIDPTLKRSLDQKAKELFDNQGDIVA